MTSVVLLTLACYVIDWSWWRCYWQVVELPPTARVVVVGDVHACADELQLLLRACAFAADRDTLVLVGDLVNKGPKPIEVKC